MKRKGIRGRFRRWPRFSTRGTRSDFGECRGTRPKRKVPSPIHVHYLYFSVLCGSLNATCSIRKRRRQLATGIALPGFSYFTSISTSAAQHTSPGKVGHSCGIHRAGRPPRGGIYICRWTAGWLFSTRKLFSGNYYRCRPRICLPADRALRVFLPFSSRPRLPIDRNPVPAKRPISFPEFSHFYICLLLQQVICPPDYVCHIIRQIYFSR